MKALRLFTLLWVIGTVGVSTSRCASPIVVAPVLGFDSFGSEPFKADSMRFQQVFDADGFDQISAGGGYITDLWFNFFPDTPCGIGLPIRHLQIDLSTTHSPVDHLSLNYAENVGQDVITVLGPRTVVIQGTVAAIVSLDRPYFYNPANGNLLVDIRFPPQFAAPLHGAGVVACNLAYNTVEGNGSSRIFSRDWNSPTAEVADSSSLYMFFTITPVPESRWLWGAGLLPLIIALRHRRAQQT